MLASCWIAFRTPAADPVSASVTAEMMVSKAGTMNNPKPTPLTSSGPSSRHTQVVEQAHRTILIRHRLRRTARARSLEGGCEQPPLGCLAAARSQRQDVDEATNPPRRRFHVHSEARRHSDLPNPRPRIGLRLVSGLPRPAGSGGRAQPPLCRCRTGPGRRRTRTHLEPPRIGCHAVSRLGLRSAVRRECYEEGLER